MLVGHEPDLSGVAAALCGVQMALQKGGLVELELDRRNATQAVLIGLEQPSHLLREVPEGSEG
jgi:phosphohistidine phosphatase SixA